MLIFPNQHGVYAVRRDCGAPQVAIYDLVPIQVRFENGAELGMKDVVAMIVDRDEKTVTFAARTAADSIVQRADGSIETDEFRLVSPAAMTLTRSGRAVRIEWR